MSSVHAGGRSVETLVMRVVRQRQQIPPDDVIAMMRENWCVGEFETRDAVMNLVRSHELEFTRDRLLTPTAH